MNMTRKRKFRFGSARSIVIASRCMANRVRFAIQRNTIDSHRFRIIHRESTACFIAEFSRRNIRTRVCVGTVAINRDFRRWLDLPSERNEYPFIVPLVIPPVSNAELFIGPFSRNITRRHCEFTVCRKSS